ncbi:dihydrofolate reductase family protein [Paracnuella aquatica]|uniref:dihydrofolate reductase family protein n=1 Tax=Paracnuella aquatica TaxID=2268757 RepID=UPI000DEEFFCA|nr:dihydrofolate reductase family protein [Paracnuella aquatica]RPD51920.1 dihydrofolate reductase [Paracnuella aquatica]
MRKIIVLSFISLDGVMQAPGGPGEDTSGGFDLGGWVVPYFDETLGQVMAAQMQPADLLLGRKTYEIFAAHWPHHTDEWPGINEVNKFVLSNTTTSSDWQNTSFLKSAEDIRRLKETSGRDLQVHGSGGLVQLLLQYNLVDELWLKIFPVTLGKGKKLFADGTMPAAFTLAESSTTPTGVLVASFKRSGGVTNGTFGT